MGQMLGKDGLLLNPRTDDIKQIIHNQLLTIVIDNVKEEIGVFGS